MTSYNGQCTVCGETNPSNSEVCSSCELQALPNSHQVVAKSSAVAVWFISIGVIIIFGSSAIFLFAAMFSSFFSQDTILFWGYFSAFGIFVYFPIGVVALVIGVVLRVRVSTNTKPITNEVKKS